MSATMCPHQQAATRFLVFSALIVSARAQVKSVSESEPCDDYLATNMTLSSEVASYAHGEEQVYGAVMRDDELKYVLSFQIGPSQIRDLRLKSISDTHAELQWKSPSYHIGDIVRYSVSLKLNKLFGCENLGRSTPPTVEILQNVTNTSASFSGLHPYAEYTANVIAHTFVPGPPKAIRFQTNESLIPTSVVNNLRFDDHKNHLRWDEPVYCTTISGPIRGVKLFFHGVSVAVQNWTSGTVTYLDHFSLDKIKSVPHELYRVRVHVIRHYTGPINRTLYQELMWWTLPAAPSAVRHLGAYNFDADDNSISLRWLPPAPSNGEIESYHVSIGTEDEVLEKRTIAVSKRGLTCVQWENYLCLENLILPSNITTNFTKVEVYAKNRDVKSLGQPASIVFDPQSMRNRAPTEPLNLTAILGPRGVLSLKWAHPYISHTKLKLFWISFDAIDSKPNCHQSPQFSMSIPHRVGMEKREYSLEARLPGSTTYRISVAALDRQNLISPKTQVEVSIPEIEPTFSPADIDLSDYPSLIFVIIL